MSAEIILIAGEFQHDRLGASYDRAFTALGHPVHRFDITTTRTHLAWPARNRLLHRLTIKSFAARRAWSRGFNEALLAAATTSGAPWVFLHNGIWVMPETVRALRKQGHRVAIFHADNPFPPHYNWRPEALPAAREADLYLIWSERLVEKLLHEGVNARFLAFGWDPHVLPYQGEFPQGTWPGVVFIGGWDREREVFLDEVARHVPLRIYGPAYWGTRTRRRSRARRCWQGRQLSLRESAHEIRQAAVCLNILRTQHTIDGHADGVIMRHFEVPGAGGVLLSSRSGVATRLFPEGKTGTYFENADECVARCRGLLRDAEQRAILAVRAHNEVSANHTYLQRAREVVGLFRDLIK